MICYTRIFLFKQRFIEEDTFQGATEIKMGPTIHHDARKAELLGNQVLYEMEAV